AAEELFRARAARWLRRRIDPGAATGLALSVALGLIFLAALGFGLVSDMVTSQTGLYRYDASAAAWGAEHATPTSTWVLGLITWLGATVTVLSVTAALGILEWVERRRLAVLAFLLMVVVGQNLIANTVKELVDRERPPVPHLAPSSGFSFPSGHTASAAATWAAVALVLGRGRPLPVKAWLAAGAALVTVAVAASRVLLGVHWLTDVIGGAALGFGWFVVCSVAFGGALLHFGAPAERVEAEEARLSGVQTQEPPPRGASPMPEQAEPSPEQVESRAGSLAAEPGNSGDTRDPDAQARALLEESEERVEDPAARDPDDQGVIRRRSDEGITAD
ncbi:MAG TPA: phosphatase PAP2 family protein, partial [Actinomycetes bacterium]|nr:phosphatase PAP2 family protein [Actinomycetes bacterium]